MNSKEYIDKMIAIRGKIISSQLLIESLIDRILVLFYSSNIKTKKDKIYFDLISNLGFQKKILLVYDILPEEFKIDNLKNKLNYIKEKRDLVAHYQWTQITDENIILFNGKTSHNLSDEEIKKFDNIIKEVRIPLDKTIFKLDEFFTDEETMVVKIPKYDIKKGFKYFWEDGFSISVEKGESIQIKANTAGLKSLANHFLNLSQENVPIGYHIHLDEYNSLEEGSNELIIEKI